MPLHLRVLAPLLAVLAAACTSLPDPAASPADLAIVGVNVIPMDAPGRVLAEHTVLIGDGRILALGPAHETPVPEEARRIAGRGRWLIPGLADMHVHLEHLPDPAILKLFLGYGVTQVRSMDGRPFVLEWRERAARGELAGPRIVTAGPIIDGSPPLRDDNLAVADTAGAREAVIAQRRAGYDFVKLYTNLSAEAFRAAVEAASDAGMPVAGHVPREVALAEAIAAMDSIEHLTDFGDALDARPPAEARPFHWSKLLLAQPIDLSKAEGVAASLLAHATWVVPTLAEPERRVGRPEEIKRWAALPEMRGVPETALEFWSEQVQRSGARLDEDEWRLVERGRANRLALVAALHREGVPLLAGTDTPNPFLVPGAALHDELALMVEAGISPWHALAAATRNAAAFLGQERQWGTIAVGRRADLVLLAASPLVDIGNSRGILGVATAGRWWDEADLESFRVALRADASAGPRADGSG